MSPSISKLLVEKIIKEPINTFAVSEGSKKGDNVAGNLTSIKIQTKSGNELNLVYKSLPSDLLTKQFAIENKSFRIENTFYSQLAPTLETWIKSKGVNPTTCVLSIPKFFDGFNDDDNDYLCMEDMRSKGYIMADKYIGLNFEETSLVMKELGKYHAITYGFIQWEGEKLFDKQEFKLLVLNSLKDMDKMQMFIDLIKGTYQMSIELIQKKNNILSKKLQILSPNNFQDCISTSLLTDKKYFPVIIFGDLWVNNILFKYRENGIPEDLKFIDFQQTRRGNIYEELQYFIFTSTTPEFRKKHLSQVLDIYYESFISTIQIIKCNPPLNFTKGKFIDSFFECYFPAFVYICFALPMQLGIPMDFFGSLNTDTEVITPESSPIMANGDNNDELMEFSPKMLIDRFRFAMESCPEALDRLYTIATELDDLKVFN